MNEWGQTVGGVPPSCRFSNLPLNFFTKSVAHQASAVCCFAFATLTATLLCLCYTDSDTICAKTRSVSKVIPAPPTMRLTTQTWIYQRGLYVAQNGYTFRMLLGYGPPNLQVPSSALLCDFSAAELETGKLGPPASAAAAWTLLFEQPYAVSDQPAHQTEWCLVFWSPYNK